jgi:response regulator RpfG family c-di-GMP phosphodiesterase
MTNDNQQLTDDLNSAEALQDKPAATLLFVDDEANILSSLRRLFRPLGYTILVANSGKEGLEILQQNEVDLIISDMRMPEMDGAEFLKQAAEQWPDTMRMLLTGYADVTSTIAAINQGKIYKYISKPWEDNDITLSVKYALQQKYLEKERDRLLEITRKQNAELQDLNVNLENRVNARTEELRQTMQQLEQTHATLKKSYIASVKVFSSLIEMREGSIPGYSRSVADNAYKLALSVGMNKEEAQSVMVAGLLHGIGKISLPDALLSKPFATFDSAEKNKFYKHPIMGEAVLMALEPLHEAARMIRSQLEHYDGRGYPDGIKGEDIPVGARILAVANDYEALKNGLFSKEKVSNNQIRDYIRHNRGKRYDPKIAEAFLKLIKDDLNKKEDFISVMSNGLEEGMVLARDIVSHENILLLAGGQILNAALISRIQRYERSIGEDLTIYIQNKRS